METNRNEQGAAKILEENTKVEDTAKRDAQIRQANIQLALFAKLQEVHPSGRCAFMTAFNFVEQFHALMETRTNIKDVPDSSVFERRIKIVDEEVNKEMIPLLARLAANQVSWSLETRTEMLDHIVDSVYVLLGTACELGLPFDEGFDLVHQANMAKFKNGVVKNEYGKLVKPEGWEPPNKYLFELIKLRYTEATLTNSVEHQALAKEMKQS